MSVLSSSRRTEWTLRVDWPICKARGFCHELVPDLIDLDEWGYPLLPGGGLRAVIAPADVRAAEDATHACPVLALHMERSKAESAT